ncbi:MAG: hypothetical protein ACOYBY_12390 [Dermatophilaceae bacterium]
MNLVVSIENATTYTPYLTNLALTNATWVPTQQLDDRTPIAPNKKIVGLLDATLPFSGRLTVHYVFLAPGPDGADVTFTFDGQSLEGSPLVGCGWQAQPATAFPGSSAQTHREGEDYYLLLQVQ